MANYLEVGQKAIDFVLKDSRGEDVALSSFKGKKVVLYFYPKDNTPGCTKEACAFRDAHKDFSDSNTVIIGISKDNVSSHSKFLEKFDLPFILLSDEEGKVIADYGVWLLKKNYGKEYMGIARTTYVIDEEGTITKVFPNVKVNDHVEKVLQFIKA